MKKRKGNPMRIKFVLPCLLGLLISSCNPTKYLAEDQKLYKEGDVVIHNDTIPKERKEAFETFLESALMPKPNKKLLGMYFKLGLWNMGGGPDSTNNFVRRWLKRNGEEPVLLSDVNREYNQNLLRGKMENLGFFHARVTSDTLIDGKFATVRYDAFPGKIYRINNVTMDVDSNSQIGKNIRNVEQYSLLKKGSNYNLDVILNERDRIDNELKHKGFYYFSPDNIFGGGG